MTNHEFREIRIRLGMTQAQLAAILGYGMALRISEFERATNPRPIPLHLAMLMHVMDETGWRPTKGI